MTPQEVKKLTCELCNGDGGEWVEDVKAMQKCGRCFGTGVEPEKDNNFRTINLGEYGNF